MTPIDTLRPPIPLNAPSADSLHKLAERTRVEELVVGGALFKQGEQDKWAFYVLQGEVSLQAPGKTAAPATAVSAAAQARAMRSRRNSHGR